MGSVVDLAVADGELLEAALLEPGAPALDAML
jgi:hypothetical protein